MRLLASVVLAIVLAAGSSVAEDLPPSNGVTQASCYDVVTLMADPKGATGLSSPLSGLAYVGAVHVYLEGYRYALGINLSSRQIFSAVVQDCEYKSSISFQEAVKCAANGSVAE